MQSPHPARPDATWFAFLACAFAVVGMTGIFACYAAPLPLARALARDAALAEAQAALAAPDAAARLEALRPRLGDSAAMLLPPGGDMPARIAAERRAMHARFSAEADATAGRLRLMIAIVTVVAAVFGCVLLGAAQKRRNPAAETSNTRDR
jgi:hypothetical protein